MNPVNRHWTSGMLSTEDWWAVWLGLVMFAAGLVSIIGVDLVGWMAKPGTWAELSWANALKPAGTRWRRWQ